jgi:glycerate dehydrogenase
VTSPFQIVVLDGQALNPGDLFWAELERLGTCQIHSRSEAADVIARSRDADILPTNKTPLTAEVLAACPDVRGIGVLATGFNVVDVAAAQTRLLQVTVENVRHLLAGHPQNVVN